MTGHDGAALRRALARTPAELAPTRGFAAVAAVLDRNRDLLLIKRADHPSDPWSGHLSFPGGRVEPDDDGPLAAAIRETREEVGLALPGEALIGRLDDLAAVGGRPGLVIRPYVFVLDDARPATRLSGEVAAILWRPLDALLANEGRGRMTWRRGEAELELPCVDFDGHRLWGLTLRMVDELLDRLDGGGLGLARRRATG